VKTVKLVAKAGSVPDFLREIDRQMVRLEWNALRGEDGARATEFLWRGTDPKGKLAHVVVQLEDGSFGLLTKQASRWRWITGRREDVLASVPDAHFEPAVRMVLAEPG